MDILKYEENGIILKVYKQYDSIEPMRRYYTVSLTGDLWRIQSLELCESPRFDRPAEPRVILTALYEQETNKIIIDDLSGNGHNSGLQGLGIGTLLVNTLLQEFLIDCPLDAQVSAELSSDVDDPKEEPDLLKQCMQRRERFWSSFGFSIKKPGNPHTAIHATLKDLRLKKQDVLIQGMFPRFVEIPSSELSAIWAYAAINIAAVQEYFSRGNAGCADRAENS